MQEYKEGLNHAYDMKLLVSFSTTSIPALYGFRGNPTLSCEMARTIIAVQPPPRVQTTIPLYPPPIAEYSLRPNDPSVYYFAIAELLDEQGNVLEGSLRGLKTVTGVQLEEHRSSSRAHFVFVFSNLSITYEGTYRIRLDVYKVAYEAPNGVTFVGQAESNHITAYSSPVPGGRPSKVLGT